jgi:hypothetical protein
MGMGQSKPANNDKLDVANILDILATKYILTQNFQDMKKLGNPDYCNKLIILTADIIKKSMNEKEITYLSQRIEDGVPILQKKKSSVIFIKPGKTKYTMKPKSSTNTHNPQIQYELKRAQKPVSRLDIQNKNEKLAMCKGIAKFYIKIAHLFSAILKTVNPIYVYGSHKVGILNKSRIPKGSHVSLEEVNLCNRRINSLKSVDLPNGKISAKVSNCNLNRKVTTKSIGEDILDNIDISYGQKLILNKNLGEEIGIPELEKLYYDIYDFTKGKFLYMSPKSKIQYQKDLKMFYTAFTGKKDFNTWNRKKDKKFKDIPLIAYHTKEPCKNDNSAWKKTYVGAKDNKLFQQFAQNIKNMLSNTKTSQFKLLEILDKIFVWSDINSDTNQIKNKNIALESKVVTINPNLTSEKLSQIVDKARKMIVNSYINCEKDYQNALQIFEAIMGEKMLKKTIAKKEQLSKTLNSMIVGEENPDLKNIVEQNISKELV